MIRPGDGQELDQPRAIQPGPNGSGPVVVAISGAPHGDVLIDRAAGLATALGVRLLGLHIVGAHRAGAAALAEQREVLRRAGGSYTEVVDDDIGLALASFAVAEGASHVVVGRRRLSGVARWLTADVAESVLKTIRGVDVVVVPAAQPTVWIPSSPRGRLSMRRDISARRRSWTLALAVVLLPPFAWLLSQFRGQVGLATASLTFLAITVTGAAIAGLRVGLLVAVEASLLVNFFFTEPFHTLEIAHVQNVIALLWFVVFAAVAAVVVARLVERDERAQRARTEAEVLARAAGSLATEEAAFPALVEQLRTSFGLDGAALVRRVNDRDEVMASAGSPGTDDAVGFEVDGSTRLVVRSKALSPEEHVVVTAFAHQIAAMLDAQRLRRDAAEKELAERSDALRASLLRAVSHDLRTPLAGVKARVSSMLDGTVAWTEHERHEFLLGIDEDVDRLDRLVDNLLDAGRLQAGAVVPHITPTAIDDVVGSALQSIAAAAARVQVDVDAIDVLADPGLLERIIANLVANSLRYQPAGLPVTISTRPGAAATEVVLDIVDRGPGMPAAARLDAGTPFRRLDDTDAHGGVGLGLAVAFGFAEQIGATLALVDTAGGGLTARLTMRSAEQVRVPSADPGPVPE